MALKLTEKIKNDNFSPLKELHNSIPKTTCKQLNVCCKSGCPPMYFVEFIYILDFIKKNIRKDVLTNIVCQCIDNFFSDDVIKPCPLFNKGCLVYDDRPINCRLYGQIPEEEYKERQSRESSEFVMSAAEIMQKMNLSKIEDVPLFHQCPHVKPVDGSGQEVTLERYNLIFELLADVEKKFLKDIEVDMAFTSYKIFHDHYLWFTIGEDMLEQWAMVKQFLPEDPLLKADLLNKIKLNFQDKKVISV